MICDDEIRRGESLKLVDEQVATLVVGVVGDEKPCGSTVIARVHVETGGFVFLGLGLGGAKRPHNLPYSGLLADVKHLQQLGGFAARSGAHVQNFHARDDVHQQGRDHADDLLSADIAHAGFRDEELLEGGEGRELANDLFRGVHGVGEAVGIPRDGPGRLDELAIVSLDLDNLGYISRPKQSLDSQGMSLGAAEPERVGQLPLQSIPELSPLFVIEGYDGVVISLEPLVLLDNFGVGTVGNSTSFTGAAWSIAGPLPEGAAAAFAIALSKSGQFESLGTAEGSMLTLLLLRPI